MTSTINTAIPANAAAFLAAPVRANFAAAASDINTIQSAVPKFMGTPTVVLGAGAGTGASYTITGTDGAFVLSITIGTGPSANSAMATITFGNSFSSTPVVLYSEYNSSARAASFVTRPVISTVSTTQLVFNSGGSALVASSTYSYSFICSAVA